MGTIKKLIEGYNFFEIDSGIFEISLEANLLEKWQAALDRQIPVYLSTYDNPPNKKIYTKHIETKDCSNFISNITIVNEIKLNQYHAKSIEEQPIHKVVDELVNESVDKMVDTLAKSDDPKSGDNPLKEFFINLAKAFENAMQSLSFETDNNFFGRLKEGILEVVKPILKKLADELIDSLLNSADSMCRKFDLLKEFLQGILIDLVTDMLTFDFKLLKSLLKSWIDYLLDMLHNCRNRMRNCRNRSRMEGGDDDDFDSDSNNDSNNNKMLGGERKEGERKLNKIIKNLIEDQLKKEKNMPYINFEYKLEYDLKDLVQDEKKYLAITTDLSLDVSYNANDSDEEVINF
uniref:Uncharacterized protein n=1 Tax=Meloidogyne floridensis TaxID=298350 RepID=A0A915NMZ6_9BILA